MRRAKAVKLVDLFVITLIVLVVRIVSSYADPLGTIEGTITGNGAALSGAHVAVTCKGVNRMATTDGSGHFSIGGLPDGTCKVIAAQAGFKSAATTVTIKSGASMSVKLALAAAPAPKDTPKADKKTEAEKQVVTKERLAAPSKNMPAPPMSP